MALWSQLECERGMQPMIFICAIAKTRASVFGSGRGYGGEQLIHAVTCGVQPSLGGVAEDKLGGWMLKAVLCQFW